MKRLYFLLAILLVWQGLSLAQYTKCKSGQAVVQLNGTAPAICSPNVGSGGNPANPNTAVQFNNSGAFGGSAKATVDANGNLNAASVQQVINVAEFATGGAGTTVSPYTGWDTAIVWTAGAHYLFPAGKVFGETTSPNYALNDITLEFGKDAIIYDTGTGNGMTFDSGTPTGTTTNVRVVGSPIIIGANSSGAGMYLRSVHHSSFDHPRVWGFHNCYETHFTDMDRWEQPECSTFASYITLIGSPPTPVNGMVLDARTAGQNTTTNDISVPIIEGLSGDGIQCVNCLTMHIHGGTSEFNNINIHDTGGFRNTWENIDTEGATTQDILIDGGQVDRFIDMLAGSASAADVHVTSGNGNQFIGGQYTGITIDNGVSATSIQDITYSCTYGIVNNGQSTSIVQAKSSCVNNGFAGQSTVFPQFSMQQVPFASLPACSSTTLGARYYLTNDGNLCTFNSAAIAAAGASAITLRGTAQTNSVAPGTSITITNPTGILSGDVMLAMVQDACSAGGPPVAAGWVQIDSTGGIFCFTDLYHVANGSEGASTTFTFTASTSAQGSIIAYTGVDNVEPILAHSIAVNHINTSATATSITTTVNGAQLYAGFFDGERNVTFGGPAGYTSRWTVADGVNNLSSNGYDKAQGTAGATGAVVATGITNGDHWGAMLLGLRPAGAGYFCPVTCDGNIWVGGF